MIEFFRDTLDGPIYIVTTIISIIFIMAIIGFIMERKKLEKEKNTTIAIVDMTQTTTPNPSININPTDENKVIEPLTSSISQEEILDVEEEKGITPVDYLEESQHPASMSTDNNTKQ